MTSSQLHLTPSWSAPNNITAYSTTRHGGISLAPFNSLNLGMHVNDNPAHVEVNRQTIQTSLKAPSPPLWLNQTHSTIVINANEHKPHIEADAIISTQSNQCLVIMTADCLPIIMCSKDGKKVAAIHAGWKGLCQGIVKKTFKQLNIPASDCLVWLGPCISQKNFEIGDEVIDAFKDIDPKYHKGFYRHPSSNKAHACLKTLALNQLNCLGIFDCQKNLTCTYDNKHDFFSYRREGITGRMATFIWIENPQ